jgi:methionyl-tRNA formyltransferase
MRLAFMGTPEFSVPALGELLAAGHDIVVVYSQPPRPSGRGHKTRKSPVHVFAENHGLSVRTPINFKSDDERAAFAALNLDVAIVVAYGLILPKAILDAPRHGCLNLHGSLLPRWRGAAPVQRAIMAGDTQTGVQVMQMEKGLDTGPVLLSEVTAITADDTAGSLTDRLSYLGAQLLPRALSALERGGLVATPQTDEGLTYANKISSDEARIDWTRPARELDFHIRGLSPFPGAWFELEDENGKNYRVKALMSRLTDEESSAPSGAIMASENALHIATGDGVIALTRLQRAGGKAQGAGEFLRGAKLPANSKAL